MDNVVERREPEFWQSFLYRRMRALIYSMDNDTLQRFVRELNEHCPTARAAQEDRHE